MEIRYRRCERQLPRVLLVASDRRHSAVTARRLAGSGYRVATADSSAAAVAELCRAAADLVLAELSMPMINGAELARTLRGEAQWKDIPIMLITGRTDPHEAIRAYAAGVDDVIPKPFHFEVLFARIERRIIAAQALKTLREENAILDARIVERAIQIGELRDELRQNRSEVQSVVRFAERRCVS